VCGGVVVAVGGGVGGRGGGGGEEAFLSARSSKPTKVFFLQCTHTLAMPNLSPDEREHPAPAAVSAENNEALTELLYSGDAFHAVGAPVALTMILSSLAVVFINDGQNGQSSGGVGIPVVYETTGSESSDVAFTNALVNALAIVGAIIAASALRPPAQRKARR
jgi:hypothetical protein